MEYLIQKKKNSDTVLIKQLFYKRDSVNKKLFPLYNERNLIDSSFIVQNQDSYVAAEMLWLFIQVKNIAFPSLENLYNNFSRRIKESYAGKKIHNEVEKEKNIFIGSDAKNFIAIDSKGDTIRLADYKNKKYVLLDFGASWCAPCRRMIPELKKEYAKYDTAIEIISIADQEEVEDWYKAIKEDDVKWPQIIENKKMMPIKPDGQTINDLYFIDLIPSLILVDKESQIIGKYGGFYSGGTLLDLKNKLKAIFEVHQSN
jgi:thiol-disulfide isomerase/thioredoxin